MTSRSPRALVRALAIVFLAVPASCGGHGAVEGNIRALLDNGELRAASQSPAGIVPDDDKLHRSLAAVCTTFVHERHSLLARHKLLDASLGLDTAGAADDANSATIPNISTAEMQAVLDTVSRLAHGMRASVDSVLTARSVRTMTTNAAGHYLFEDVPSGSYIVWASMTYWKYHKLWLQPTKVGVKRDTLDLDTRAAVLGKKHHCNSEL